MPFGDLVIRRLAAALAAGQFEVDELIRRGEQCCGHRPRWLRPLVQRLAAAFPGGRRPPESQVYSFLWADDRLQKIVHSDRFDAERFSVWSAKWRAAEMAPARGSAQSWKTLQLNSVGALAEWLDIPLNQLAALADWRSLERHAPGGPLRNYRYRLVAKRSGGLRLIESPKSRLKEIQRCFLHEILDRVPAHFCAHGFLRGRSIKTFIAGHTGRNAVLRMDLCDFFPSIRRARIVALFMTIGYPEETARCLAGLCTNTAPGDLWRRESFCGDAEAERRERRRWEQLYGRPHLPQGAPTSGALANLCAYRLDCRLAGLARFCGAAYSRYADDLLFSGDESFSRIARRFALHVGAIALDEGFQIQHRKTRIQRRGARQQAAGVVLNVHTNVRRDEYDRLKAILCNCRRHGPASQNRDNVADFRAHLLGCIAHVAMLNPHKGNRLRARFEEIEWGESLPRV